MHIASRPILISILACCFAASVPAKELVKEFRGSESRYTGEFNVKAPWIVDWWVTSDLTPAVEVNLVRGGTGVFVGKVLKTKRTGNGVRLFDEGGHYQFRVNSTMANWVLRVEQLTEDEARLYTPITED